jgi:hypothetical protein
VAAGFSKDSECELFILLEITGEHKVNGIIIYQCNIDESAEKYFRNKAGKW